MSKPARKPRATVTDQQQRFVSEYLIDLNATQASIRAGYSARNADKISSQLMGKPRVREAIELAMQRRARRTEITQDRVLEELGRIAFFDLRKLYREDGSLKRPTELDDDAAAVLAGIDVVEMAGGAAIGGEVGAQHIPMYTKKAKTSDKVAALGLAMRHLGMLKDRTEVTGPGGGPVQYERIERSVVDPKA